MNHLVALQSLKAASQVVGKMAAKVGEATMQAAGSAGTTFHELLSPESEPISDSSTTSSKSTADLRMRIAEIAERVMHSIGVSLDQPLNLTATESGGLQLDSDHPRAAEASLALNADPQLPELVNKLLATADSASRHFVLHRVETAPEILAASPSRI